MIGRYKTESTVQVVSKVEEIAKRKRLQEEEDVDIDTVDVAPYWQVRS